MGQVVALDELLIERKVWRGQPTALPPSAQPTGHALLDAALPLGGWPEHALIEVLHPVDGVGEFDLLVPTLARLTQGGEAVAFVAPPYVPYAHGLEDRGFDLRFVHIVDAEPSRELWAFEQCLRSGACAAVLGWPRKVDDHGLRRLQVAADAGRSLAFVFRDAKFATNPSPAALRLDVGRTRSVRVRKCRGGVAPAQAFVVAGHH
ncbi:translesion DNA synthesis-associated protein ImuA [Cognatilysobacter terrigena]|uniref:translesion DNA synthesis-associated protein ImuA n=1 Tax=Cognatilysobacter terrigena TaxID=2488749 RepID=UPI00105BADD6|nr:translesion DNA synthesis-associated protein ImuA [Lysobacter terrigena]